MSNVFRFGQRSEAALAGIHPDLLKVVVRALVLTTIDFGVVEGLRSLERQKVLYAQGRTKPGAIVTGTMNSRHLAGPDGFGRAVDLVPINDRGLRDWNFHNGFLEIGHAMHAAAKELGIPIRWGWDWDGDGILQEAGEYDGPHFELSRSKYP